MEIIKRNGTKEEFNPKKIERAVQRSAERLSITLSNKELKDIIDLVVENLLGRKDISVNNIHNLVEMALEKVNPLVAKSYKDYRNYKAEYGIYLMNDIENQIKKTLYEKDRENSNSNTDYISTKRTEIAQTFSKEMYQKMYLSTDVISAMKDGYIYVHDLKDQLLPQPNCVDPTTTVNIREHGRDRTISLKELDEILDIQTDEVKKVKDIQILSRKGYVKLISIMKRKLHDKDVVYKLNLKDTGLTVTNLHRIPVINSTDKEEVKYVQDISITDKLLVHEHINYTSKDYISMVELAKRFNIECTIYIPKSIQFYIMYKYSTSINTLLNKKPSYHKEFLKVSLNDYLKLISKVYIPMTILSQTKISAIQSKVRLPLYIEKSSSFAKIIGYIFADGGVMDNENTANHLIVFTNSNTDLIQDFREHFFRVFGIFPTFIAPTKNQVCYRSSCGSRLLVALFRDLDGDGSKKGYKYNAGNLKCPKFILNGSRELKLEFLSSLIDTDGCLSGRICYTTSDEEYANEIKHLLQEVFLGENITLNKISLKGTSYNIKGVVGTRNFDNFNVLFPLKDEIVKELKTSYKANKYIYEHTDNGNTHYEPTQLQSIEIIPNEDVDFVYDLQTEDGWFIANNILVHNCLLADIGNILRGGFELEGIFYTEPKDIKVAVGQLGDVVMIITAQHFGK